MDHLWRPYLQCFSRRITQNWCSGGRLPSHHCKFL